MPAIRPLFLTLFFAFFLPRAPMEIWAREAPDSTPQEAPGYTAQEVEEVTQSLRKHYYDRAWELGSILGEEWNERAPEAIGLRAWYALNLARNGSIDPAMEVAEDLKTRAPDDAMAWFGFAGSVLRHRERSEEALEASARAYALDPDNLDIVSLHADVIRLQEGEEEGIAFVDGLPPAQAGHPLVLLRKAVALHGLATQNEDEAQEEEAYDLFREIIAKDDSYLEPVFFLGTRLNTAGRTEEAAPLLERAGEISVSPSVHLYLWRPIEADRELSQEEKIELVEADIQDMFARGGETPGALLQAAGFYERMLDEEKRDSLYAAILATAPESVAAEWVLVNRYREVQRTLYEQERAGDEQDPELKAQYRRRLEEFLMRPVHHQPTLKGDAYRNLLYLLAEEEAVDPELLYSVVRGVELFEGINIHIIYAMAPITLAEQGAHLDYALELARKGIVAAEEQVEEYQERRAVFRTPEEMERAASGIRATMMDAVGFVLLKQERLDEAEGELLRAYQLNQEDETILNHLGQLYEARYAAEMEEAGDPLRAETFLDQAQEFYLKGTFAPVPGDNPNDQALEDLYRERYGSLEGLDEVIAEAATADSGTRKEKILGERLEEAKALEPFSLATLGGDLIDSESLEGKITIINFWGTWCGPCVIEMPGIQEVHDLFSDDPDVVVLTLSNDENPDVIRRFMEKEEYTFPVLLDDGYVRDVGVRAFPTTWFIDGEGKIWFEKRGWSDELAQEFAWRVEALKEGGR